MNADSHTSQPVPLSLFAYGPLSGTVTVPGDKSISHRSLMFGALAVGETIIDGLLEGEDVLATAAALRACGADITRTDAGRWHVHGVGVGGLLQPRTALDMGNSGTSTRLLMGLFATHPITVTLTGDASLSRRPMARVTTPLAQIGATFTTAPGGCLPLRFIHRSDLFHVQPAGGLCTTENDPANFVGHQGQIMQRLTVVLQRADIDFSQSGASGMCIQQQADINPVTIFEIQRLQQ